MHELKVSGSLMRPLFVTSAHLLLCCSALCLLTALEASLPGNLLGTLRFFTVRM